MSTKIKIVALLTGALLVNSTYAEAGENFWLWLFNLNRTKEVKPVTDTSYQSECGDCHYAYPPGLLPARSWEKLLDADALPNHFGSNAEINPDTLKTIQDYAMDNAADKSFYKRSRKIALATKKGDAPLRITEVRYIKRAHQDIPEKMIKGNKGVKSLSFCDKCHTQAARGIFDKDTVSIPNYPDWDSQHQILGVRPG